MANMDLIKIAIESMEGTLPDYPTGAKRNTTAHVYHGLQTIFKVQSNAFNRLDERLVREVLTLLREHPEKSIYDIEEIWKSGQVYSKIKKSRRY